MNKNMYLIDLIYLLTYSFSYFLLTNENVSFVQLREREPMVILFCFVNCFRLFWILSTAWKEEEERERERRETREKWSL